MKEDGERVTVGVFGKWQCRGKDCGKEKKNEEKMGTVVCESWGEGKKKKKRGDGGVDRVWYVGCGVVVVLEGNPKKK